MTDYKTLTSIATALAVALMIPAGAAAAYYWFLALTAFLPRRRREIGGDDSSPLRFAIVIPAHNEQLGLGTTLQQLQRLDYPRDSYDVFVIADNCSDNTARVANEHGVHCLERFDTEKRGKDHALEWAYGQLLERPYDAYMVLDADCQLDEQALRVCAERFRQGRCVLQCNYLTSNPDENSLSYGLAVANFLENYAFYAPKSRLGWTVFLRGTGMVFHRKILETIPWQAGSIVEDLDYSLKLAHREIAVEFLADVSVHSAFPVKRDEFRVQRRRWIHGGLPLALSRGTSLIWQGIKTGKAALIEAGWSLLLKTRSAVFGYTMLTSLFAFAVGWIRGDLIGIKLVTASLVLMASYVCYFALGMIGIGLSWKRLQFAASIPLTLASLMTYSVSGIMKFRSAPLGWVRTPRSDEGAVTATSGTAAANKGR